MASPSLIPELTQALQQEIDAVKSGKGGTATRVFDGRLVREAGGYFVYLFRLENFLAVLDDTPGELEIGNKRHPCQIVSVQGLELEVATENDLGPTIPEARVQTSPWFLLEILRKKLEEANAEGASQLAMSERVFAGATTALATTSNMPPYNATLAPPNDAQHRAVVASFNNSLAIIWGPPGTGKTKTIAQAAEAHLNAGRRVLLVSHANTAVDEALANIAKQLLDTSFYREGKLIRLGIPHKKELGELYPLVMPDKIVAMLGEALAEEKDQLLAERAPIDGFMASYEALVDVKLRAEQAVAGRDALEQSIAALAKSLGEVSEERAQLERRLGEQRDRMSRAQQAGLLKRLFFQLDPKSIQRQIDRLAASIEAKKAAAAQLAFQKEQAEFLFAQRSAEADALYKQLSAQLATLGLSIDTLAATRQAHEARRAEINVKIAQIDQALSEVEQRALNEARLVATTLTKTFSSKQFPDAPFDALIVDESSMAPLPHLYWAFSKAATTVTVVGDFKQLPPICVSEEPMAKKWLRRSIFDVLGVSKLSDPSSDHRVSLLDTQYRMAPKIAGISNTLFYGGRLRDDESTKRPPLTEPLGGDDNLVLVNTAAANPPGSRRPGGSRLNLYSALVSVSLAQRLSATLPEHRIGIIAPYRPQARLIDKIATDQGIRDHVRPNTVHSFQGGEEEIIIFDCVDGPGLPRWSMLDDKRDRSDAQLLLNVALTRAKRKLFLVAHKTYFQSAFAPDAALQRIIEICSSTGCEIQSNQIVADYVARDFEQNWARPEDARASAVPAGFSFHTEKDFWSSFRKDLESVGSSLAIMSPFATRRRSDQLIPTFAHLAAKGVRIRIYTRPPRQQTENMAGQSEQVIRELEGIGVRVVQRADMHQKIALIDDNIVWAGSLNILSHNDTQEQMHRFEGENTAKQIIRDLQLDRDDSTGNVTDVVCEYCGSPKVWRNGPHGRFLGCSNYARCPGNRRRRQTT